MEWRIEKRNIEDLKGFDKNPRKFTKKGLKDLKESLERCGDANIITINSDNTVLGGHARLEVMKQIGVSTVDVKVPERLLNEEECKEIVIRLNANTAGEWDLEKLALDFDCDLLTDWGLDIKLPSIASEVEEVEIPENIETRCKLGDIWQLGNHRLMCGDSTKTKDVENLMNGAKADMVFTDPPYGVNIKGSKQNSNIQGDLTQVAIPFAFANAVEKATKEKAIFYFCGGETNIYLYQKLFDKYLHILPKHLIWVKNSFVMKQLNYHNQYELIFFGYKQGGGNKWCSGRTESEASDVWHIKRDTISKYVHPTQKPIEIPSRAIKNSSYEKELILDLFGGSGSTLIACEQLNRSCYCMELDPKYCDVILQRWENMTGKKAVLVKNYAII